VVPGVIIGISLLTFATKLGTFLENNSGIDVRILTTGLFLMVCVQSSFLLSFENFNTTWRFYNNGSANIGRIDE